MTITTIKGDESLKIQLFQNLIGNAIKYRSQEHLKFIYLQEKKKNQYLFSIKDNGIGISPEHLTKIFTIFQRLHTHEEHEGTGIGLAIAQKIVHQQEDKSGQNLNLEKVQHSIYHPYNLNMQTTYYIVSFIN